jgi:hypothetical protein
LRDCIIKQSLKRAVKKKTGSPQSSKDRGAELIDRPGFGVRRQDAAFFKVRHFALSQSADISAQSKSKPLFAYRRFGANNLVRIKL